MDFLKRIPFLRIVLFLFCLVVFFCSYFRVFDTQELSFYDLRLSLRGKIPQSDKIVIVEISDDTLKKLGRWPLPRNFHASLTDVLKNLGARVVVFDILFAEESEHDETLRQAFSRAGIVYLPQAFSLDPGTIRSRSVLAGIAKTLAFAIAGDGHINVTIDPDGKTRRVPLFVRFDNKFVPSLGLKVACDYLGIDVSRPVFKNAEVVIDDHLVLPVARGNFLINYPGLWKDTFRHFSYYEILKAFKAKAEGHEPAMEVSVFKDKICFVGLSAAGTSDLRANPLENVYPMVGAQASIANSILKRDFVREAAPFFNGILALAFLLACIFVSARFSPLFAFLADILILCFYFFLSQAVFLRSGICLDLFFPILVVACAYGGCLLHRFLKEERERQLLEKELEIASAIQKNFLPRDTFSKGLVKVFARMQPAKFVAGDLYDIVELSDGRIGILIGDVCGKGVSAALIMAQTVSFFRIFARQYQAPAQVLSALNRELIPLLQGRFVTAVYLIVDPAKGSLEAAVAGHCPPLVYRSSDDVVVESSFPAGPPLGLMPGEHYKNSTLELGRGDRLLLFTDGVTESRRQGKEFGVNALMRFLKDHGRLEGKRIAQSLLDVIIKFQGKESQFDDIAYIVVEAALESF